MIKFDKNTWFLSYIVCFLFIFDLALSYKIPLVLPISGLIILCIVPGFLFCLLFRIKVTDLYENFLYSVGLSIVFDLLFGLLINTLLPIFGVNNPLSSQNLQICFSIVILLITLLIVYADKAPIISFKLPKILNIEKIFLTFGFIILLCIQIGIYLINIENINFFLIFSILLIPLLLFFLIIYPDDSIKRIYPFIIYLISISLLMLFTLRSNYIIGIDSHEEYFLFYNTLTQSVWIPDPTLLLSAALSISIVPTVFEKFLSIDPQLLFKILFPLIFSITPLIIYMIVKKYVNALLALCASCLFMFYNSFIITSANSRTSLAIFFFSFAVLTICNKELSYTKKYGLVLLFIAGTIFSHYTTALIFFLIIFSAYLTHIVLDRYENRNETRFINLPIIIYFVTLIFFWYEQIINNVFKQGFYFTVFRLGIFNDLLKKDVSKYIYPSLKDTSSLMYFTKFTMVLLFVFIGIGILFAFYSLVQKKIPKNSFPELTVKINRSLLFMGICCLGLLVGIVFAPFLFFQYDTGRTLELIFVVLSVFLIIGACNFFKLVLWKENLYFSKTKFHQKIQPLINYCQSNQNKIVSGFLLFLLIPSLLLATGITYQIDGFAYSIILNSPKSSNYVDYGYAYIYDQDAMALQWIKHNSYKNPQIFSDGYGDKKLNSLVNQEPIYAKSILEVSEEDVLKGYIFLSVINEYYDTLKDLHGKETKITLFGNILSQKNKIYTNEAVLYL